MSPRPKVLLSSCSVRGPVFSSGLCSPLTHPKHLPGERSFIKPMNISESKAKSGQDYSGEVNIQ